MANGNVVQSTSSLPCPTGLIGDAYRAGQWNIVPLLAVCALLVAAGAVDLSEEALIGVLVAQQSARAWRIESLQAVVVKLRHLIHPSHPRVSQHLAALVPCATSVDTRAC